LAGAPSYADDPLDKPVTVHIASGTPLDLALIQLGEQISNETGYHVMLARTVGQESTPGLQGTLPANTALRSLLANTGLTFKVDNRTITIAPAGTRRTEESKPFRLAQEGPATASSDPAAAGISSDQQPSGSGTNHATTLEEVVVTAQKRSERLQDVPVSISVLGGADLDRSSFEGVTEALNTVPGVATTVGWQGGGTQVTIRGVTASGALFAGSSAAGYYLDSAPFGLVRTAVAPDSNAYDLAQVEVLRGPQGTLYGASALNGVVRVLTNDADLNEVDFKARTSVSATQGGGGNYRGDVAVNVPIIEGKLALRAVVGYDDLSGWINSAVAKHVNNAEERSYRLKIKAQPTDDLSVVASAWRSNDDYGAPSVSSESGQNAAINPQPIATVYDTYSLKVAYGAPGFSVTSVSSYLDYSNSGNVDLVPYYGFDAVLNTSLHSRVYSQELLLTSTAQSLWRWTAGAFYRDGKDQNYQPLDSINAGVSTWTALTNFNDRSKSYAVYGEFGRQFADEKLQWTLGGRYFHDEVSTQAIGEIPGQPIIALTPIGSSFNHTSPRAVLTWFPSLSMTAYVSYSQGFRSGIAQDEYVTFVAPGFAPAKPDTLNNYEIGMKGNLLDHRLGFDTSLYYIDWRDVQQVIELPVSGGLVAATEVNGTGASGIGYDLGLTAQLTDELEMGLTFSWNDLRQDKDVYSGGALLFNKGQRLNYSPEYTLGGSLQYDHKVWATGYMGHLAASASYTSEMTDTTLTGDTRLLGIGNPMLNVRTSVSVSSPGEHWTTRIFADNLTNDRGTPLPYPPIAAGYWDSRVRPRTVGLQLDYHFK